MPFNGSGSFTPPGADFPAVANTLIEAAKFNNVINDIATGLSTCITKDGQTTVTANIPFGGYRLTSVGAGVAASDAARVSQLQNGSGATLGTIAGTNTITAVASPVITAYAANQKFIFLPANTNTGATTINIDGIGAKNIYLNGAACTGGELVAGTPAEIFYDGTQFQIVATGSLVTKTGAETLTNKTLASPTLTGTVTGAIANWSGANTFAAGAVFSGTASNIQLGANHISYGGTDAGISVDSSNNVTMSGGVTIGDVGVSPVITAKSSSGNTLLYLQDITNSKAWQLTQANDVVRWYDNSVTERVQFSNLGLAVTGTLSSTGNLTVSGTGTIAGHGTTASAANTYIDSSTGLISRSTSSMKYKRDAEPINPDVASKVLSLKPIWYRSNTELCVNDNPAHSWYGLSAEEVAAVDPRFVFWGYDADDYEEVSIDEEVQVPLMETEMVPFKRVEVRDGVPTLITGTEPVKKQKTKQVAVVDASGNNVFEDRQIKGEDDRVIVERVQLFHDVPQFTTEIKKRTERRLKTDALKKPQGVDYARLIVPLLPKLKELLAP